MEETIEQKIIRNIQGTFAVYKTTEVVGHKANVPNVEWEESEEIDKFFMFAKNLGAKVIYLTEGEEEDEQGQIKNTIVQIGFLHEGIMHHIDFSEEEDDEEEYDEEYDEVEDETPQQTPTLSQNTTPSNQGMPQANSQFLGNSFQQ